MHDEQKVVSTEFKKMNWLIMVVLHDCDKNWSRISNNWDLYARWRSLSLFSLVEYWSWTTINCTLLRKRPLSRRQWAKRLIIASQLIMLWLIYVVWCKLWSNWKLYPHFGRLFLISKLRYIYKNKLLFRFDYSLICFFFFRLPCMHHG